MQVLVRSSANGHVTDRVTVGRATGRPLPSLRCPGQGRLVDRWPFASSSLPGTVAVSVARATFPLCCVQTLGTATDVQTESCGTRSHRCHWHFLGKTGQREQQRGRSWPRARLGRCPPGAAGAPGGRRGEHSQGSRCAAWGPAIRLPPPSPGGHWSPWEDQSCNAVGAAPGTRPGWRRGRAVGGSSGRKPALSPAVSPTSRTRRARSRLCARSHPSSFPPALTGQGDRRSRSSGVEYQVAPGRGRVQVGVWGSTPPLHGALERRRAAAARPRPCARPPDGGPALGALLTAAFYLPAAGARIRDPERASRCRPGLPATHARTRRLRWLYEDFHRRRAAFPVTHDSETRPALADDSVQSLNSLSL